MPPPDGISLLNVKNELLLSYLQNLVFLIILKLRNRSSGSPDDDEDLEQAVVKKLVELRVYLEKGVRPLEGRLKYQIDKVLRAADDAARAAAPGPDGAGKQTNGAASDKDSDSEAESDDATHGVTLKASEIDDLQYRPNPSSLVRPVAAIAEADSNGASDGLYKPPRITATAMPTTGPREEKAKKTQKSATLEEFVNTELSAAPMAEASIGSNIISGGRRSKSEKERKDDAERKEYEEKNYVRLPKESKKDKAKKKGSQQDAGYGGEEWRGIGEGLDRIERLTKRQAGASGGKGLLEKSRKRAVEDGPRSSGSGALEMGQGREKRLKALDGGRRDRGTRGAGKRPS